MSAKINEVTDNTKNPHCLACGSELRNYSILVCSECLDDECGRFMKLAETLKTEE